MSEIRLGVRAENIVTGFTGIVTSRVEYLNGCVQFCLAPPVDKDGKTVETEYVDIQQLKYVDDGIHIGDEAPVIKVEPAVAVGGPQPNQPPV